MKRGMVLRAPDGICPREVDECVGGGGEGSSLLIGPARQERESLPGVAVVSCSLKW